MSKITCPYKFELCEDCKQVHVPITAPLVFGKRLCTNCSMLMNARIKKEKTTLRKINLKSLQAAQTAELNRSYITFAAAILFISSIIMLVLCLQIIAEAV